jgi:hypothetical protein
MSLQLIKLSDLASETVVVGRSCLPVTLAWVPRHQYARNFFFGEHVALRLIAGLTFGYFAHAG